MNMSKGEKERKKKEGEGEKERKKRKKKGGEVIHHRHRLILGVDSEAYRDWETDRKSTRLNSSHSAKSRMPSSA